MNILSVDKLGKYQASKKLFENISFGIEDKQKIALIGTNGTGKSTLLRIISGKDIADEGNLAFKKGIKINFLEQIPVYKDNETILENIFSSDSPKVQLIKNYELLCEKISEDPENDEFQKELEKIISEIDHLDAWQYENSIRSILSELNINHLDIKMSTLSGGMLKKVALAQTLIDDADLLILDEPTNHLDLKTIQWLQEYLQKTSQAILLVTHDRYLVDNVCTDIYEIDRHNLYQYSGNYSYYLEKKAEMENSLVQEEQRIKSILRVELEWLKIGAKARSTKQKARIDRANNMINREKYKSDEEIEISITGRRLGKKILEAENISKTYQDKKVIKSFSHKFKQGERIGIIGENGSGKTTFLKLLTGTEKTDTGKVDIGINTHFGFFDQYSTALNLEMPMIDYIKDSALYITLNNGKTISAGQMLEKFLFPSNTHYTTIGKLSGGEKRRLFLLHILMKNPNFLIFDEPTNDLDIKTLSILEDFLNEFGGCLIVVSHDRYFMDRVVDYLLVFDGQGNIKGFPGNYSDYLEQQEEIKSEEIQKQNLQKEVYVKNKDTEKKKLSFKEKYEMENLEKEIEKLEKEKSELDNLFSSGEDDFDKISKWNDRYKIIEISLNKKMERWEYLASIES
ncbi:MAG: ABC-F family ATP-binding cassette domain-containing protein [Candidatus Sericytochromatia bacterium]